MDWSILYPDTITSSEKDKSNQVKRVEFADIGCGYGGLLGKKEHTIVIVSSEDKQLAQTNYLPPPTAQHGTLSSFYFLIFLSDRLCLHVIVFGSFLKAEGLLPVAYPYILPPPHKSVRNPRAEMIGIGVVFLWAKSGVPEKL